MPLCQLFCTSEFVQRPSYSLLIVVFNLILVVLGILLCVVAVHLIWLLCFVCAASFLLVLLLFRFRGHSYMHVSAIQFRDVSPPAVRAMRSSLGTSEASNLTYRFGLSGQML